MSKDRKESRTLRVLGAVGTLTSAAGLLYLAETSTLNLAERQRPHAAASERVENARLKQLIDQACSYSPDVCRLAEMILKNTP